MQSKFRTALAGLAAVSMLATSITPAMAQQSGVSAGVAAACANVIGAGSVAAAQSTTIRPGCVLPAIDTPPPVAPPPLAVAPIIDDDGGKGFSWPLILGLAALAGLLYVLLDDDDDEVSRA